MKCRYLRHVLPLVFIICGFVDMRAEISKADILATVDHLRSLTHEAQHQAADAKLDTVNVQKVCDGLADQLHSAQEQVVVFKAQAHENAKERDVIIVAFALVLGLYVGTFFAGEIMRDFPTPWNIVATGCCYVIVIGLAYGLGRLVLHSVAGLIP